MSQHPLFRTTDPETSREAALSIDNLTKRQQQVLEVAKGMGEYTLQELVPEYQLAIEWRQAEPQSPSGIRTRHKELVDQDLIVFTGKHALTASGRRARVWKASDESRTGVDDRGDTELL